MRCSVCDSKADVIFVSDTHRCFTCHKKSPKAATIMEAKGRRSRRSLHHSRAYLRKRPCAYCGAPGPSTVDHYLPKALGGTNALENLRPACQACNQRKGAMHPYDWEELLQKERRGLL